MRGVDASPNRERGAIGLPRFPALRVGLVLVGDEQPEHSRPEFMVE